MQAARPGAMIVFTSAGMKTIAATVTTRSTVKSVEKISVAKRLAPSSPFFFQRAREKRNEGGVERPFREEAAEQVGKAEGEVERVRDRPDAERRGHHHFAGETEDAGNQRRATNRGELLQ